MWIKLKDKLPKPLSLVVFAYKGVKNDVEIVSVDLGEIYKISPTGNEYYTRVYGVRKIDEPLKMPDGTIYSIVAYLEIPEIPKDISESFYTVPTVDITNNVVNSGQV